MIRTATAIWNGSGKEGSGDLTTQSKTLSNTAYSFQSRFEEGQGTNPEELIGAALAGCYSMKLSFIIGAGGKTPDKIETRAEVKFENGAVPNIHLIVKAKVPGASKEDFQKWAEEAKNTCPVSKVLKTDITMEATLEA